MKKYFPFTSIILLFFVFLTVHSSISVFPEMRLFPYLIHKGLTPYKDFFDHHGFLLYYLLAPFIGTNTLPQKIIYVTLQTLSLLLFMLIIWTLRMSKKQFGVLSFTYALVLFYLGDNTLWYETLITPLLLMLFISVFQKKNIFNIIISGVVVFFLSAIKPLFIVSIIPVLLKWKTLKMGIVTAILWIIVILYFMKENAIYPLYISLILFNAELPRMLQNSPLKDPYIILPLVFLSLISLFLSYKNHLDNVGIIISFLFLSYIPLLTGFWKPHLVSLITFLMVTISLSIMGNRFFSKITVIVLFLISFFIIRKIILENQLQTQLALVYTDDYKSEKAINYLRQNYPHKPLYVFSNRPEFYTELDTVPPVYFPLKFPGVEKYYPNYETNIMNSIKRDNIERVVFVMPLDTEFENQKYLKNWIMQNSVVEYQDENTQIRLIRHVRNQSQF
ncbi:hypothetical protein A3D77_04690 [Candidatus Gottesmanbacteria bacterium RIFCSPHIGHO2_02_FULL_39_11]|uniref:Glycosyltransferase RgtA/B/C/D-like domain-containing protein n=1 Tax=Candidatus Gottesmanbacteria bacterium RIFCSPHIGHO2_02_FULL_39_11 TaxID=1798382 RepID=A0A1F5ZKI8_9BACT|nr:MAG: hypothetical protein A3D77_04690 [Candidatus Gottesmanbacteria bacterium RIFCSPHIGHO2_02_FULL_39_11]